MYHDRAQLSDNVIAHPAGQDKHVVLDRDGEGGTFIWVFANRDSFG